MLSVVRLRLGLAAVLAALAMAGLGAAEAVFYRAVNLNGPALEIDGHAWEGNGAPAFSCSGKPFANQAVALKPPTDAARTRMIRSSHWGDAVEAVFSQVPAGPYQAFVYVWEDNNNERFSLTVNGRAVLEDFNSGSAGMWKRLGPWPCESVDGRIRIAARGGAANLSGVELWSGAGPVPAADTPGFVGAPTADQVAFFEQRIRPVLVESCYECHSAQAKKLKGGLLLDSRAGLIRGGDTGPVVMPGDPDASALIIAVRHADKDLAMPKKKLPAEQIAALEDWVRQGAPDPRLENTVAVVETKSSIDWVQARTWWSLTPLAAPPVPTVRDAAWPANDLDRFVLARLEQAGLAPAADADKRTLIRRATYDLIGLPPTPQEVDAFLADRSPAAFATVVDRLLASPHYGERWGRHWLDVVRYADTAGDNSDFPIPQQHRYRDWVIDAHNRDLPYDRFVRLQLAGDLMPGATEAETHEGVVATGYLANARRFGSRVDDYPQHLTIEDTIDNLGRAFLGLTVNCARCHDHKFDPITAADYYALYGILASTRYPWPGIELDQRQRDLVPLAPPAAVAAFLEQRKAAQSPLDAEVKRLEQAKKDHERATEAAAKQAAEQAKPPADDAKQAADDAKKTAEAAKKAIEEQLKKAKEAAQANARAAPPYPMAYAVAEGAKRGDAALQHKGDPAKPGPVVRRRFLTVLGGAELPADDASSGRLRLADWLLDRANPLPARVMANRVWLHHFGSGLVPTPNDFGKQGKPPSHPELLDWLAARFIADGWSLKRLHRVIMLSRTWRLGGSRDATARERDPDNRLLAGFPRQRLDAEAIRDTLLTLGGSLDRTPGGAHPFPPPAKWDFTQHKPFKATYDSARRSVYLMQQRIQRHPYLSLFDGADPSTSTPLRAASTTPLQALYLLNDALVHEQAAGLATRLLAERADDEARMRLAYALAFAREPRPAELAAARGFLAEVAASLREGGTPAGRIATESWQALARVLFRLNEFIHVD